MDTLNLVVSQLEGGRPTSEVLVGPWSPAPKDFGASVARTMSEPAPRLDYRFLYNAVGSELFEAITRTPEYYPTRTEASLLERCAAEMVSRAGSVPIVELGAGSGRKTSLLLSAAEQLHGSVRYVPVDVSVSALEGALAELAPRHPKADILPVHGTYGLALELLGSLGPALGVFLGSSLGNLDETEEHELYRTLAGKLGPDGAFLLGVDLVKSPGTIERAYDDEAGVTRAFVRNLFARLQRELGAELDLDGFDYHARYRSDRQRVELHASLASGLCLPREGLPPVVVAPGQEILVEICRKFELASLSSRLHRCGLAIEHSAIDPEQHYALLLLRALPATQE